MSRRIRSIKPEILDDERTAGLSHVAWRLFVSALVLADDQGNLRAGATYLAGQVFHTVEATRAEVRAAVVELVSADLWRVYVVRGQEYAHIRGWTKHQRIDNAGKPKVPGPSEADGSTAPTSAPTSDTAKPSRNETTAVSPIRGESPRVAASRRGSPLEVEGEAEVEREWENTAGPPAGACVHAYTHESPDDTQPPETSRSGAVASVMVQTALAAPVAPFATPDAPEVPPAPAAPRTAQPEAGAVGPAPGDLTLTPTGTPTPPPPRRPSNLAHVRPDAPEAVVFAHWARVLCPKAIFTKDRARRIAARLAEGFTAETLCKAVDGVVHSDWHMGRDPGSHGRDYRGLETIFRDAGQVEKFVALAERHDPRHRPQVTRRVDARRAQLDAEVAALMATPMGDAEALAQIAYFNETGKIPNAAQMAALLAGRSVRDAIAMLTTTTAAEEVTA